MTVIQTQVLPSTSFHLALENYSRSQDKNNVLGFRECSLQDVLDEITQVESLHEEKWVSKYRIRSRLNHLISFVDRYAKAVDCLVQTANGSGVNPAAFIWGLLRVLLETASSAVKYFASLMDLLEDLGRAASLYTQYDNMYSHHPRFQNALVNVYVDIMLVLQKAHFRDDIVLVKRHLSSLEQETTLAHRSEVHILALATKQAVIVPETDSNIVEKVTRWLAPIDCYSRLDDITATRDTGSGTWLLENETYSEWKNSFSEPIIWITGQPGIGKTVLSSTIITNNRRQDSNLNSIVGFFHCDAGNARAKTANDVLSNIIFQILEGLRSKDGSIDLPQCIVRSYHRSTTFGRQSITNDDSPGDLLLELVPENAQLILIIDGIDELDNPEELIMVLDGLVLQTTRIQIAFLGRELPQFEQHVGSKPHIRISTDASQHDIASYVARNSGIIPVDDDHLRQEIVKEITSRAEGMFLWAHLVLEDISTSTSITSLKGTMRHCPAGLDAIYARFLDKLASQTRHRRTLASDILNWICCAARPLTLNELEAALSTSVTKGIVDDDDKPFRRTILDICGPFIAISPGSNLIRPVHHSFREYMLGPRMTMSLNDEAKKFLIVQRQAHAQLAIRCLIYSQLRLPSELGRNDEPGSFYRYAINTWCHHALSSDYDEALEQRILNFLSIDKQRQTWLYWMLFKSHEPFPFAKVIWLQKFLAEWLANGKETKPRDPEWSGKDWSINTLSLILDVPDDTFEVTYFGKMMVIRDLARRLNHTKQLSAAVDLLEKLQSTEKDYQTEGAIKTMLLLNSLGILYDQQGRFDLAIHTHREALAIQTFHLGESHPKSLWSLNEMGRMYRHLGLLEESEKMHSRALEHLSIALPDDHPEMIWTINTLATTLRKMRRPEEALKLHMKAYEARARSLGDLHVHTLWSAGDVAKCYRDQNLAHDALEWYRKAYNGRSRTLGPEHPDTLWSMNDLGNVLQELGRSTEAYDTQTRAREAQKRVLGVDHEHTMWTMKKVKCFRNELRMVDCG
ncbi:uncharacterized protein JN550_000093 [Neoarthrinium moseri]|uniref:uncharacterized protein n=1 Tax=Neoarthrinium moseri TaxID=1658444 RepID=UPI001FDCD7E1|nr:uncharacterized protein JN550_000093 [Neoarthrinium moseri]KAI1877911.1 hypothetical protein JN550_000093 [Neoarthrinium moseri]